MRFLTSLALAATCLLSLPVLAQPPLPAQPLSPAGEGRRLYLSMNCYSCHGMYTGGGMGPGIAHSERGDVSEAVMQGKDEGMPSYRAYLNKRDVRNLTAYLQSIGGKNEPVFMDWWEAIPPK
jgi:mono/diheme cytochrome c family protein